MATYYSSSTDEREIAPTIYLRDMETTVNGNILYLNYPSGPFTDMLTGNSQSQQNCINLPTAMISENPPAGGVDLVSWRGGRNEDMLMQTIGASIGAGDDIIRPSVTDDPQMALRAQLVMQGGQGFPLQQSNVSLMQNQGLSLSLGTQIPVSSYHYHQANPDISITNSQQSDSGNCGPCRDESPRNKQLQMNTSPYGFPSLATTVPNSKYLEATQQLLDEVINVRKALEGKVDKSHSINSADNAEGKDTDGVSKGEAVPSIPQESTANSGASLSPYEKQDLQNKITKLLAMLDEVDRRYKQYYHQMQIVVSSFDVIAGCGAAKPYTALALQAISRHFRCLRDAISGQIRSTRKSLGEDDSSSSKAGGISRLRYIDQQIRQQRAMQQLGMMQPHAWRPQRGLPETSVSILRAWLFEHFLHPYPKDSEKLMLARQTGLTRSQVSNWFINARVRLWKPMIEEMYKEEIGDMEMDSNSSSGNAQKTRDEAKSFEDREDLQSPLAERSQTSQFNDSSTSNLISESTAEQTYLSQKFRDQRHSREEPGLLHDVLEHSNLGGRFMAYHQMADFGNFGNGGVSLTLALQHPDDGILGLNSQPGYIPVRGGEIYDTAPLGAEAADFDCMNLIDRRQRFEPSQILHDFVA